MQTDDHTEKQHTISLSLPLTTALSSITLAYNWLSTTIAILHLQQFLVQGVHPSSSPLMQLPHFSSDLVKRANAAGVSTVPQFGKLEAGVVEQILDGAPEGEKRATFEVAKNWPVLDFIGTTTAGAFVISSLRLSSIASLSLSPSVLMDGSLIHQYF